MRLLIIIAASLIVQAFAGPINNSRFERCAKKCTSGPKFRYQSGKTYSYDLESNTVHKLSGTSPDETTSQVKATVEIEAIDGCEFALHIHNAKLLKSEPGSTSLVEVPESNPKFGQELSRSPLRFAFQDGKVEELCPTENEQTWTLNFKRSVLTAFQNSMQDFESDSAVDETDITGKCPTSYSVSSSSGYNTITRTKTILKCSNRHGRMTSITGSPYDSNIKSLPWTDTKHECKQVVHPDGFLQSSECVESHLFRPFSNGENGAVAHSNMKLTFGSTVDDHTHETNLPIASRTSLLYDHEEPKKDQISHEPILAHIKSLCDNTHVRFSRDIPKHFGILVDMLKKADTPTIQKVHASEDTLCTHARHYFHDAIPMVGTEHSVGLIKDMIMSKHVGRVETNKMLASLGFIQKPNLPMIRALKPLSSRDCPHTLLSISALVNKFCSENPNCGEHPEVSDLVGAFEEKLGNACFHSDGDSDTYKMMLASLKAIANIGHGVSNIQNIENCIKDGSHPTELRLAAIDAFRRMGCDVERRVQRGILATPSEDSEVRINAYLALMKCPSSDVINWLREDVMPNEESQQVGTFMYTHLRNVKDSPFKSEIDQLLNDPSIKKKFDEISGKFSRNFEKSFFWDKYNVGGKVEGNLIFSDKSIVPRSGNLNLNVDMFGNTVNLLEFGGRVEGLEALLDSYYDMKKGSSNKPFTKHLKAIKASAFLKVFGSEVVYGNEDNMRAKYSQVNTLMDMIKKSYGNIDFSKTLNFVDTVVTIPTVSGMPLRLAINGTASVHLQMETALTLSNGIQAQIKAHPSAVVEVTSHMFTESNYHSAGLQMVSNLYSSMAMKGRFDHSKGRRLLLNFALPETRNEVIRFSHKLLMNGKEMKMAGEQKSDKGCDYAYNVYNDLITELTDLKLCMDMSYVIPDANAPRFLLSGPFETGITLLKTDPKTSYFFNWESRSEMYKKSVKIILDTEGSSIKRRFEFTASKDKETKEVALGLITPWVRYAFKGASELGRSRSIMYDYEYKFNGIVWRDDIELYSLKTSWIADQEFVNCFSFNCPAERVGELRISSPRWKDPMSARFQWNIIPGRVLNQVLLLKNIVSGVNPIEAKIQFSLDRGTLKTGSPRYDLEHSLTSQFLKYQLQSRYLDGKLTDGHPKVWKSTVKYQYPSGPEHTASWSLNYRLHRKNTARLLDIDWVVKNSMRPYLDHNIQMRNVYRRLHKNFESRVQLSHGPKSERNNFKYELVFDYLGTGSPSKVAMDIDLKVTYEPTNSDWRMQLIHTHNINKFDSSGKLDMSGKRYGYQFALEREIGDRSALSGIGKITTPSGDYAIQNTFARYRTRRAVKYENSMSTTKGENQMTITGSYEVEDLIRRVSLVVRSNNMDPISLAGSVKLVNPLKEIKAFGSVKTKGQIFSASLDHTVAYTDSTLSGVFVSNIVSPKGSIKFHEAYNFQPGLLDIKTDCSVDFDKSYKLAKAVMITYNSNSFSGDVSVKSPWRDFEGQVKGTYQKSKMEFDLKTSTGKYSIAKNYVISYPQGWREFKVSTKCEIKNLLKEGHTFAGSSNIGFKTSGGVTSGMLDATWNSVKMVDVGFNLDVNQRIFKTNSNIGAAKYKFKHDSMAMFKDDVLTIDFKMSQPTNFMGRFNFNGKKTPLSVSLILDPVMGEKVEMQGTWEHRMTGFLDGEMSLSLPKLDLIKLKLMGNGERKPYVLTGEATAFKQNVKFTNTLDHTGYESFVNNLKLSGFGQTASSKISLSMAEQPITAHVDVDYNGLQLVNFDGRLTISSKSPEVDVKLVSPLPVMELKAKYDITGSPFTAQIVVKYGTQSVELDGSAQYNDLKSVSITGMGLGKSIRAIISLDSRSKPVKMVANLAVDKTTIDLKTSLLIQSPKSFSGDFELATTWAKKISGDVKLVLSGPYQIIVKGQKGPDKVSFEGTLANDRLDSINLEAKTENPWMPCDIKLMFSKKSMPITWKVDCTCKGTKMGVDGSLEYDGWRMVKIVNKKFYGSERVEAVLLHDIRRIDNMKHEVIFSGMKKLVSLKALTRSYKGHVVSLQSPWVSGTSTYNLNGNTVSWEGRLDETGFIKTEGSFDYNEGKNLDIELNFESNFSPKLDLKVLTQLIDRDYAIKISGNAGAENMNFESKVTYGGSDVNSMLVFESSKSPKIMLSLDLKGNNGNLFMSLNSKKMVDLVLSLAPNYQTGNVKLTTDIKKLRVVQISYNLIGETKTASFDYSPSGDKPLKLGISYAFAPNYKSANIKLTTDIKKPRSFQVTYDIISATKTFTLDYSPSGEKPTKLEGLVEYAKNGRSSLAVSVDSPSSPLGRMELSMSSNLNNMRSTKNVMKVSWMDGKQVIDLAFGTLDDGGMGIKMESPWNDEVLLTLTANVGNPQQVRRVILNMKHKTAKARIDLKQQGNNVELLITSTCPYMRDVKATAMLDGSKWDGGFGMLKNSLGLTHDRYGKYSLTTQFKLDESYNHDIKISAESGYPIFGYKTMEFTSKTGQSGSKSRTLETAVKLDNDIVKLIGEAVYKNPMQFEIKGNVESSWTKPAKAILEINIPSSRFAEIKVGGKYGDSKDTLADLFIKFDAANSQVLEVVIETPWGDSELSFKKPESDLYVFHVKHGQSTGSLSAKVVRYNLLDVKGSIDCPFTKSSMELQVSGNVPSDVVMTGFLMIDGVKHSMSGLLKLSSETNYEYKATVNSPLTKGEVSYELIHAGSYKNSFETVSIFKLFGKEYKTITKNVARKGICYGSIVSSDPSRETFTISWDHKRTAQKITTKLYIGMPSKFIESDLMMEINNPFAMTLGIKTPFARYEKLNLDTKFAGELKKMSFKATLDIPIGAFSLTGQIDISKDVRKVIALATSPFVGPLKLVVDSKKTGDSMDGSVTVQWGVDESVGLGLMVVNPKLDPRKPSSIAITLETPFSSMKQASIRANKKGDSNNIDSDIIVNFNSKKVFHLEGSVEMVNVGGMYSRIPLKVDLKTRAPVNWAVSVDVKSMPMSLEVNWDTTRQDKNFLITIAPSGTYTQGTLSVSFKYPKTNPIRSVTLTTALSRTSDNLKNSMELSWEPRKTIGYEIDLSRSNGIKGDIKLKGISRKMAAKVIHGQQGSKFISEARVSWDVDKNKFIELKNTLDTENGLYKNELELDSHYFKKPQSIVIESYAGRQNKVAFLSINLNENRLMLAVEELNANYSLTAHVKYSYTKSFEGKFVAHIANLPKKFRTGVTLWAESDVMPKKQFYYCFETDKMSSVELDIQTPIRSVLVDWSLVRVKGGYKLTAADKIDGKWIKLDADITDRRQVSAKIYSEVLFCELKPCPWNFNIEINARNPSSVEGELYSLESGKKDTIVKASFELTPSKIINSKIFWKESAIPQKVKDYVSKKIEQLKSCLASSKSILKEEVEKFIKMLGEDHQGIAERYVNAIGKDLESLGKDHEDLRNLVRTSYGKNDFYMRDIMQGARRLHSKLSGDSSRFVRRLVSQGESYADMLMDYFNQAKSLANSLLDRLGIDKDTISWETVGKVYEKLSSIFSSSN